MSEIEEIKANLDVLEEGIAVLKDQVREIRALVTYVEYGPGVPCPSCVGRCEPGCGCACWNRNREVEHGNVE